MRFAPRITLLAAVLALAAFTPAPQRAGTINLTNGSSSTVVYLYASVCEQDTWGDDLLPTDVLEPGSGATITMDPGCWDLKAVTDSEQELMHFGVNVEDGGELDWTIEDAE